MTDRTEAERLAALSSVHKDWREDDCNVCFLIGQIARLQQERDAAAREAQALREEVGRLWAVVAAAIIFRDDATGSQESLNRLWDALDYFNEAPVTPEALGAERAKIDATMDAIFGPLPSADDVERARADTFFGEDNPAQNVCRLLAVRSGRKCAYDEREPGVTWIIFPEQDKFPLYHDVVDAAIADARAQGRSEKEPK